MEKCTDKNDNKSKSTRTRTITKVRYDETTKGDHDDRAKTINNKNDEEREEKRRLRQISDEGQEFYPFEN